MPKRKKSKQATKTSTPIMEKFYREFLRMAGYTEDEISAIFQQGLLELYLKPSTMEGLIEKKLNEALEAARVQ